MGRVVTAACRSGCAALLAAALWACGLSVSGEAPLGPADDASSGGSSGGSNGVIGYGSSGMGSSGSSSGSGLAFDTGLPGDGNGLTFGDATVHIGRDAGADSRALADAGPGDAPDDGATCAKLSTCCSLLAAYGTASTTVASCQSAAATKNASTCQGFLSPIESLGVCP